MYPWASKTVCDHQDGYLFTTKWGGQSYVCHVSDDITGHRSILLVWLGQCLLEIFLKGGKLLYAKSIEAWAIVNFSTVFCFPKCFLFLELEIGKYCHYFLQQYLNELSPNKNSFFVSWSWAIISWSLCWLHGNSTATTQHPINIPVFNLCETTSAQFYITRKT